jgi:hypothetical protein
LGESFLQRWYGRVHPFHHVLFCFRHRPAHSSGHAGRLGPGQFLETVSGALPDRPRSEHATQGVFEGAAQGLPNAVGRLDAHRARGHESTLAPSAGCRLCGVADRSTRRDGGLCEQRGPRQRASTCGSLCGGLLVRGGGRHLRGGRVFD